MDKSDAITMQTTTAKYKLSALLLLAGVVSGALFVAMPLWAQTEVQMPSTPGIQAAKGRGYLLRAGDALADKPTNGTGLTLEDKQKLVERNADALQILRVGFAYERERTPSGLDEDFLKNSATLRALARLLIAEGQVYAARGDVGRAASSYLDVMRLGVETTHGAPLIGGLLGVAFETMGRRALWEISGDLNAVTTRQCARRLEIIEMRRTPFADSLRAEKAYGEKGLREFLKDATPSWNEEQAMTTFSSLMDAEIAQTQVPYIASTQRPMPGDMEKTQPEYKNPLAPTTPEMTKVLFAASKTVINQSRYSETNNQAQNALLLASLALRAYQLEHGHFPKSLALLAPEYFEQIPLDPFSLEQPLQYKLQGDKYLLYSLGPDGDDDAGTPMEDAETKSKQANSQGDIVA